jgi:hypothetical protein
MDKVVRVECYSGSRYGERPVSFILGDEQYVVKAVEKSWRTPSAIHFRVQTGDNESFELTYREKTDEWNIEKLSAEAQE